MDSKKLFKRKYRYIQKFTEDKRVSHRSWVGFYRIGEEEYHERFFQDTFSKSTFPHYGFSFYEDPPGRIVRKGKGNTPSIFQSNRLINLGLDSLIKTVKSTDMFSDKGLSLHRQRSFVMVMGTMERLISDLGFLREEFAFEDGGGIWSTLNDFDWVPSVAETERLRLRENQVMYDEVFHLNTTDGAGYGDFVYLTANSPTSFVLSHATVQNIIHSQARHLKSLIQIPLNPAEDAVFLKDVFSMNSHKAPKTIVRATPFTIFGVFPGLFGFKGAVFDVATGLVTGKRKDLVQFLLLLNGLGLLAQRDLRYLV